MNKIILNNQAIEYTLKRSNRARYMRLAIHQDASLVVTAPNFFGLEIIEKFIKEKASWILKKILYFRKNNFQPIIKISKKEYLRNKEDVLKLVLERAEYFKNFYNLQYKSIKIKNQKTRWGSCSRKGNININFRISLLPKEMADYIIVHELCHLREFNHSKNFWALVSQAVPDYQDIRKNLRKNYFK